MEHYNDKINVYFAQKGVNVIYNMLGYTPELVLTYVNNFSKLLQANGIIKSHHYKTQCYNKLYEMDVRPKYTGFENFKKLDKQFRKTIAPLINDSQFTPALVINHDDINESEKSFKEVLKKTLKTISKPLLYLSGGIDSELVAKAMIDANVKFTPVIFQYVNNQGQTLNIFDFKHAFKFCQKYGLFPITKTINLEKLWDSKEFANLAIELKLSSPQLVTHAYMVELMADEFKDYTHIFGGEVRFESDFISPDTYKSANLVYLAKIIDTVDTFYSNSTDPGTGERTQVVLRLYTAPNWYLRFTGTFGNTNFYEPWYTVVPGQTPSTSWFYRVVPTVITQQGNLADLAYTPTSDTGWLPVSFSGIIIGSVTNDDSFQYTNNEITVRLDISIYGNVGGVDSAKTGKATITAGHFA